MKEYLDSYDVIVVGGGHAGCEAALASARMGLRTMMVAMTLESIAMMPCNPSIGGTGKGHLVREIDALGGEMGINTDKSFIQIKMLNTRKGPAVHSLRCQSDKSLYHMEMKKTLEKTDNLDLRQGEVVDVLLEDEGVCGVELATKTKFGAKAVILATGTFLKGKIFIGEGSIESGPNGLAPSVQLADKMREMGIETRRFKTGTPARALASSLDFSKMSREEGDDEIVPFSFMNESKDIGENRAYCYLTYTNENTHEVIRKNFHRSALFTGEIEGVGARYCPSIEDKVNRFPDRKRHQTFIEPEGLDTDEVYIQGMSSSLPEDVQLAFYKTIPGLENIRVTRPAYAIEYDCIDPQTIKMSMESRSIERLFFAGQINGSSGYEEAAAQGLMAGINAALKLKGKEPFILQRDEAYIGVLIDDLVTKGTNEPYRMMTSRAEYRLTLRQDNADKRLTEKGYEIGLVTEERYEKYKAKYAAIDRERQYLTETKVLPSQINPYLESMSFAPVKNKLPLMEVLKRPEISYAALCEWLVVEGVREDKPLSGHAATALEVELKYAGYLAKQQAQIENFRRMEGKKIPEDIDYDDVSGLRIEARQKLKAIAPESVGQASRISGVSPADINVLLIYMERRRRRTVE